ncbi:PREDICTED: uncharacterized protein LOC105576336 [Cercocebus atys]|uniref:uncharacterized protein LOC105576336 n=1 Tax=Cercocebus atys TaxID=9531 RepID=UPI0005F42825|nr:PREDICTED: uncharacterized protein LOC105576336 [Cercocebus atys]
MRLLPHNSLHRPSSIVTTASVDPAPASQSSLQAQNFLKSTAPDPAPASHCRPKGQLLPHGHLPRASACFTAELLPPGDLYRLHFYFWLCLEAQILPLRGLSSCQTSSGQPLQAQLLLPATGLLRPSPAHASGRPPQAQDLTSSRPRQAPNFLRPATPGPVAASRPHVRAQLLLFPAAAAGPVPASRQPLWTRLRPSSRSAAFVGPKRAEAGPGSCPPTGSPRPRLPPARLSRPSSSCRRPLQAHAGLEWASPGLAPAPGGLCGPNSWPSRPLPAHLLPLRGLSGCQTSSVTSSGSIFLIFGVQEYEGA